MADKHGIGTLVNEAHELATDALDLFTVPPIEVGLIHGKEVTIYPSSVLTSAGPVEFIIPSDNTDFTALNLTRLEGEIEVVKLDGSAFADTDKISIVNLFPQSLFKQIEVSLNDIQICDLSTPTYHYKSFIETHLTYNDDIKTTSLKECELYLKDDAGKENVLLVGAAEAKNTGFMSRKKFFQGKKLYFSLVPHIDFFQCPRLLIPGVDIKIKLIRADDSFSIISDVDAKIVISKLVLRIRRITADPTILGGIETKLNAGSTLVYPIVKSVIKSHLINAGTQNTMLPQVIRGRLPRSFNISFVSAKAYDSNRACNPFCFQNFTCNYLNILVNGEPLNPTVFQPDFSTENYIREYRWFLDNIGLGSSLTNSISKEEFKDNSFFMPFDMTPDLCNSFYLRGNESGTIDINLGFKTALTENIYCLLFASYDEVISIDKNRNITIS